MKTSSLTDADVRALVTPADAIAAATRFFSAPAETRSSVPAGIALDGGCLATAMSVDREGGRASVDSLGSFPDDGTLAAFGQCYLRIERCHFGRVAVAPARRGEGLGTRLLREMADWGLSRFGPRELSLFVLKANDEARRLYERLGFRAVPYPDPALLPDAHYMIADRMREQ